MASSADVRDIMGMAPLDTTLTKDFILGTDKKRYRSHSPHPTIQWSSTEQQKEKNFNIRYSKSVMFSLGVCSAAA